MIEVDSPRGGGGGGIWLLWWSGKKISSSSSAGKRIDRKKVSYSSLLLSPSHFQNISEKGGEHEKNDDNQFACRLNRAAAAGEGERKERRVLLNGGVMFRPCRKGKKEEEEEKHSFTVGRSQPRGKEQKRETSQYCHSQAAKVDHASDINVQV